jgi:RES domain-containing protein
MSIWYRAHRRKNVSEVFSGDGGLFAPGRWHFQGRKVVYGSESIALATLEWLSHSGLSVSGFSYHRFSFEVPDSLVKKFSASKLPLGWNDEPALSISREFADIHLFQDSKFLALQIASVMVPEEYNIVLNPLHEAYSEVLQSVKNLGAFVAPKRI